ncbi:MAG: hypothetical protein AB8I80_01700, partial [Anaerolineae bacterium]
LQALKDAGADKIGVAIDLATPELFDKHRGRGVGGPHQWERYIRCLTEGCRRVEKTTTVTASDGSVREFHESVRMYSRQEMVEMLRAAGFLHPRCYGSLDKDECSVESKRLILIAEKGTA